MCRIPQAMRLTSWCKFIHAVEVKVASNCGSPCNLHTTTAISTLKTSVFEIFFFFVCLTLYYLHTTNAISTLKTSIFGDFFFFLFISSSTIYDFVLLFSSSSLFALVWYILILLSNSINSISNSISKYYSVHIRRKKRIRR